MTVMNCWVNRNSKSAADIVSSVARPQTTASHSTLKYPPRESGSFRKPVDAKDIDNDQVCFLHIAELQLALV